MAVGSIPEMVERARNGEEAALERLYRLHSRQVYSLCLQMTSNQAEAEDLTQEVFLQAFRKLSSFRGDVAFSTWIYRIGTNVALMRLRNKAQPEASHQLVAAPDGDIAGMLESVNHAGPTRRQVVGLSLRRALDQLLDGFKKVFIQHDAQGNQHDEMAELTRCLASNSNSQLRRARQRLRELLGAGKAAY